MKLTEHFDLEEFEFSETGRRKGIPNKIPGELIPNVVRVATALEKVRENINKPIRVLSGYRSPELNKAVGGSPSSAHMKALAVDVMVDGIPVRDLCKKVSDILTDYDQIIEEFGSWVHIGFSEKDPRKQILVARKVKGKTQYTEIV